MSGSAVRSSTSSRIVLLVAAVAAGILLGWLCARVVLVGSAVALIPWAIVGLALGWFARSWRLALLVGPVYGFVLAYAFMIAGYAGAKPLTSVLLPFIGLGLIGAVFGLVCAVAGSGIRRLAARPS